MDKLPDTKDIQVAVLMGGLATRLGSLSANCPKALMDINGRPFFDYELKLLKNAGFRKFVLLVGKFFEMVEEYYGDGSRFGVEITYSYDGSEPVGTGGAVCRALDKLGDDFMLIYGDSFMDIDYHETVYRYFDGKKSGKKALMTVYYNNDKFDKSNVIYKDGNIVLYDKKNISAEMNYIDYGIEMFDKDCFNGYREKGAFDIAELLTELSKEGSLSAHEVTTRFYEIGSPASLTEFKGYAQKRFDQKNRAVFLDRDGVINRLVFNEDTELLDSPLGPDEVEFIDGVFDAVRRLKEKGYFVFMVTNQPAAAKGKTTLKKLYDVNTCVCRTFMENGADIDKAELCPHHPKGNSRTREPFLIKKCDCRKPGNGMIEEICRVYSIDRENSYMAGDSYTDIAAGKKSGL
ncbi:MAG: HAD-IIIA family hydrolase, partial [Lachnospiraceae bacterium]|nr:HAD-IIIA family hydrolase [Lachnospiraceae bacterium]